MSKGNILFFDEYMVIDPIARIFDTMGYNTQIILPHPTLKPEHIELDRVPNVLIYEPWFAMRDLRTVMRPTLDRLIEEAKKHKAKIAVLTTQEEPDINRENLTKGVNYDCFFQKPERPQEILRVLGL